MLKTRLEERVVMRTAELNQAKEKLKKAYAQVTTLRQLDFELSTRLDVNYVMELALDASMRLSMATSGFIGIANDKGVWIAHVLGHYNPDLIGSSLNPEKGITGRVMRQQKPELIADVHLDPDYQEQIQSTEAQITL